MIWFWTIAWALVVTSAALFRSRFYAIFVGILLGLQVLAWWGLFAEPSVASYIAWALSFTVFAHYLLLIRPSMRPLWYRVLISWPALFFVAGSTLAIPWAIASALGYEPTGWWIAYLVSGIGFIQSLTHRPTTIDLALDGTLFEDLGRAEHGEPEGTNPLRIGHLTDTHLGPFVSEQRLRKAVERMVDEAPDLILLTGDYMTMESQDAELLIRCFEPLRAYQGRVFACRGNHDLEAPDIVQHAFDALDIPLLINEEATTEVGEHKVQIVGIDFKFRHAAEHVRSVSESIPRRADHLRVVLLHHPGHFQYIPEGLGDLVLSGHTHGGQVGLVDLGLNLNMLRLFVRTPDHGFWAKGTNRLYISRGLGHYGFPLRIGVRAEESILQVFSG